MIDWHVSHSILISKIRSTLINLHKDTQESQQKLLDFCSPSVEVNEVGVDFSQPEFFALPFILHNHLEPAILPPQSSTNFDPIIAPNAHSIGRYFSGKQIIPHEPAPYSKFAHALNYSYHTLPESYGCY